jgi:hypothetical protein
MMIKSLILGSAACLVAMSEAPAADLPIKAKAVEYVKLCSLYGPGFFYIPGTDTCTKFGGYVRLDTTFNGAIAAQPAWSGDLGQGNRYADYFTTRSRLYVSLDTRTSTEYGLVRIFSDMYFQFQTLGGQGTTNPNSLNTNLGNNTNLLDTAGGGYTFPGQVFLQFAGFTFGKSASAYATFWGGYPGNNSEYLLGGHDSLGGLPNIQYSAEFGNGVSGTIGLDEPTVYNSTAIYDLALGLNATGIGANTYAGQHAPDVVGNIRIDQAWGLFQLSAAAHDVSASYNDLGPGGVPTALSEINGHPDDKWGGSVMAALYIKNIPTGAGDDIKIDASYAKGDTKNVISTSVASPNFAMFGGTNRAGAYESIGFGATTDAVYTPALFGGTGDLKLTEAYGVRGAFNHNWDPYWSSSLYGSASAVRYNGSSTDLTSAMGQYCAAYVASTGGAATKSPDFSCNPDFNVYQLGLVTRWTPVKNLAFSAEVQWFHLDQMFTGASTLSPSAPKPTAVYQFKDQDTVTLNVRVQRNF